MSYKRQGQKRNKDSNAPTCCLQNQQDTNQTNREIHRSLATSTIPERDSASPNAAEHWLCLKNHIQTTGCRQDRQSDVNKTQRLDVGPPLVNGKREVAQRKPDSYEYSQSRLWL